MRDLGKGEPADLVMPEQFTPYQRVYLGWDPDWMKNRSDWLDLAVNVVGFVPFGALLLLVLGKGKNGLSGLSRLSSLSGRKEEKSKGEIAAQPSAARNDMPQIVIVVVLAVLVGFGVSLAIELLQAYLPSRDSSLRDLITNVLGTAIGAIAAAWLVSKRAALVTGDQ